MKKFLHAAFFLFAMLAISNGKAIAGGSVAGTAAATEDSICDNASTTLTLTGYVGNIQWQSFNGTIWVNETGPGATTDSYTVTLILSTDFRAVVTAPACPSDTSNVISIVVGVAPPVTTGATRCGYGPVSLSAVGNGTIRWYDQPTGGTLLSTGDTLTTNVAGTTTFYATDASNGGASGTTPMPAQNSTFTGNARGYWFIAPSDFRITGLFAPLGSGTTQNIAVLRFVPPTPPPLYATTTNAFNTLFLTQNDPTTGVIPVNIQIYAGDVIGVLATRGANDANSYATSPATTTINGQSVTLTRMGMQFPLSTNTPHDIWTENGGSISRLEITYEVGCESPRTPAVATVTAPTQAILTAADTALCAGETTTLTASSTNPNYTYAWSPATGLSATTGTSVTANPSTPTTYVLVSDDGTCGDIDSVFIDVGPASVAGTAFTISDTVCSGANTLLTLTGSTGTIYWQSNDGTGWVNETGPGNDSSSYTIYPTQTKTYRAFVVSGGCAPDSSNTLSITVITIGTPTVTDSARCGPGVVTLTASGNGTLNWYTAATGGNPVNTGTSYAPNVTTTTTWYVENSAGSGVQHVGPPDAGMGNQTYAIPNDYGIQFDVAQTITLEKVHVYPGTAGTITVNLRQTAGGPVLSTASVPVVAGAITPIPLNFVINPGINYRLELENTSPQCTRNTAGAVWPYTAPGVPVTLTANLTPNANTGTSYYFFYDWEVSTGCKSTRVPVTATVYPLPPVPVITPSGNLLTSSALSGNQWYLNGNALPGETNQTLLVAAPGTYTVTVTDSNGCASTSAPFTWTGISYISNPSSGIAVYPNPVQHSLTVELSRAVRLLAVVSVYNTLGEQVLSVSLVERINIIPLELSAGIYSVSVQTTDALYSGKVVKE